MIRTTITPVTTQIILSIPKEYIDKKIEVLLYSIEEMLDQGTTQQTTQQGFKKRQAGILKGKIWTADDFDAPLEDFKDYM